MSSSSARSWREIVELQEQLNFAILFITHDLSLLLEIADRIAVMYAGRLVESATAEQIHPAPRTPTRAGCSTRSRACAARGASSRASPARRPTCAQLPPAARSCRAAGSRRRQVPRASTCALVRSPDRRWRTRHRVPVRPAGGPRPVARRGRGVECEGTPASSRCPARSPTSPAGEPAGQLVLEARVRSTRTTGSGGGPRARAVSAVRGRLVRAAPGTRRGARRRERLGQVDRRQAARRAGARDLRRGPARRRAEIEPSTRGAFRAYKSDVQMVFQDPFASLNPVHTVRYTLERAVRLHQRDRGPAGRSTTSSTGCSSEVRLARPRSSSTRSHMSSQAGSASACRSRGHSRPSRASCSPTSRSRCSTSRSASRCST